MAKCLRFRENLTKTSTGGLTAEHRKTPQEMWATDGGSRDPVRLIEEFLRRLPSEMRTSGPLYLTIIQRPKTEVWYAKSKMAEHKLGSIMKTLAKTLNVEGKRISNQKEEESWTAKAQDHSDHRPCQRMLTR